MLKVVYRVCHFIIYASVFLYRHFFLMLEEYTDKTKYLALSCLNSDTQILT